MKRPLITRPLTKRPRLIAGVAAAIVVVLAGSWFMTRDGRSIPDNLPNVVLIVLCSTRADQTPMYGVDLDTMPYMSAFSDDAIVFNDGVTAAPWTRPAVTAILTGSHPGTLGMLEPVARRSARVLPSEAAPLAERLHDVGYTTIGRSANPNISRIFGFEQGFDDFENLSPRWVDGVEKVSGSDLSAALLAAVAERDPERPLYVQAVYVDSHQPMTSSRSAGRRWKTPDVPLRVGRYRAMLRTLDAAVYQLLLGLEESGVTPDNTVFVVVSDHGEGLSWPVHHGRGHGRYLYPSTTRMVWMMRGPGISAGRVDGLVSQVDVLPTLLDHMQLPLDEDWEGISHAASLVSPDLPTTRQRAFTATMFANTQRGAVYTPNAACLGDFDGGEAVAWEQERERPVFVDGCFDRSDPSFLTERDDPTLRQELTTWWTGMSARLDAWGTDGAEVPDDVDAMLRALGYTDDP